MGVGEPRSCGRRIAGPNGAANKGVSYAVPIDAMGRAARNAGADDYLVKPFSVAEISLMPMLLRESTPPEYQRVFAEIAPERPDAIIVHDTGDLVPYLQLIVELVAKSRLPAMYGYRDYVEAGGLMAYEADLSEAGRRMADDVHQISQRDQTGGHPDISSEQIRSRHQSENRQGPRPHFPADIGRRRRRNHRMRRRARGQKMADPSNSPTTRSARRLSAATKARRLPTERRPASR